MTAVAEMITSTASATPLAALPEKIENRTATVAILGLGYVGLPMALAFVEAGFPVIGVDTDPQRCDALKAGRSYITDVTDKQIQDANDTRRFQPHFDPAILTTVDVILICVPTPLRKSKDPDLSAIMSATEAVAKHLKPGQLIVLESTTYPGTTEEVLLPILNQTGLTEGEDYALAFSPERVDPGNPNFGVHNITKLVGGVSKNSTQLAADLYRKVVSNVVPVSNPRVAEASKLLENTFRSVNIALANEMALICEHLGIDVWEVIDAASTKPFGFMPHYPGPGIGGHCIPLDPHYLSWKARLSGYEPKFISLASEINNAMPHRVVDLIGRTLNDHSRSVRGSRILLLGMAYKPNVSDHRESPALEIAQALQALGAQLRYSDPHVPSVTIGSSVLTDTALCADVIRESDCVVVLTHHKAFDFELVVREAKLVVDTRNATRKYAHLGNVRFL